MLIITKCSSVAHQSLGIKKTRRSLQRIHTTGGPTSNACVFLGASPPSVLDFFAWGQFSSLKNFTAVTAHLLTPPPPPPAPHRAARGTRQFRYLFTGGKKKQRENKIKICRRVICASGYLCSEV